MATPFLSNLNYDESIGIDNVFENHDEAHFDNFMRYVRLMDKVSTFMAITEIIQFFLILGVIGINIYFIGIVCRNKNLYTIKANRYLLHCFIFNIFMWSKEPIYLIILQVFKLYQYFEDFGAKLLCVVDQFVTTGVTGMFLCMFGIGLEWLLAVSKTNMKPFVQKLYDHSVLIIYLLCTIKIIIDYIVCDHIFFFHTNYIEHVLLFALLALVIYCNIKSKTLKAKTSYLISVINLFVFSWIPLYCYDILHVNVVRTNYTMTFILNVTDFIPEYLAYGSPIVIFIWLSRKNKYFKVAYRKSCSCCTCCRAISDYSGDDETFEDSEEMDHVENVENMSNNATLL
ncbi:uncharacterized protein LOC126884714 [Diabrotica virgifera virgifera]|uniref:Uncharacterized protein n=1 Tax=Diabrotica virgifera virgifera TaxID=50390 RepID=A0ABM5K9D5_DIAVI|nr:uncharacterized protein LOC126884714 [Diabrotica virgifera virgifera]